MSDGNENVSLLPAGQKESDYFVNEEILAESAKSIGFDIAAERLQDHKGPEYLDSVQNILGDPNFGRYFRVYLLLDQFKQEHPEHYQKYSGLTKKPLEEVAALVREFKADPLYQQFDELKNVMTLIDLNQINARRSTSGPLTELSAEYAKRAKLVFPEEPPLEI